MGAAAAFGRARHPEAFLGVDLLPAAELPGVQPRIKLRERHGVLFTGLLRLVRDLLLACCPQRFSLGLRLSFCNLNHSDENNRHL